MASEENPSSAEIAQLELHGLIPPQKLFPDEDPTVFQGLRAALLQDLAPVAPYERVLAENLVSLEWEALRCRNRRDALIWAAYRDQAMHLFQNHKMGGFFSLNIDPEAREFAFALTGSDPKKRAAAEKKLADLEIPPSELLADAWAIVSQKIEPLERMLADVEPRRRKLREDYDRLVALSVNPLNDAEVLPA